MEEQKLTKYSVVQRKNKDMMSTAMLEWAIRAVSVVST